jgi:DNA polymerase-3 subunit beta
MKITCQRQALATAFQTVSGIVPGKTTKTVLMNTKVEAFDGEVTLLATDGESSIRYSIPDATIETPGALLLPTSRTLTILRELQGDQVTVETLANNVRVQGERADYKLGLENPDLFPTIADFKEENYHVIDAGTLRQLIRRTIFAVDTESTRYALGGVQVELGSDKVTMAATDTRRLSVAHGKCAVHGHPNAPSPAPVVPAKALAVIERCLGEDTAQVLVAVRSNDMLLRGGLATIYTRLVEGRFPAYQDVIPTSCEVSLDIPVEPFLAVVRQSQIVTNEESRGVDFVFQDGVMTLVSQAPDIGESKVDLPISYDAAPLTISLDPKFVSEFLRVLDSSKTVHVELTDSESAVVLKTDDGSIYIVMPLSRDR